MLLAYHLGSSHCGKGLALTLSLVFTETPAYICQEQHSPSFSYCNTKVD